MLGTRKLTAESIDSNTELLLFANIKKNESYLSTRFFFFFFLSVVTSGSFGARYSQQVPELQKSLSSWRHRLYRWVGAEEKEAEGEIKLTPWTNVVIYALIALQFGRKWHQISHHLHPGGWWEAPVVQVVLEGQVDWARLVLPLPEKPHLIFSVKKKNPWTVSADVAYPHCFTFCPRSPLSPFSPCRHDKTQTLKNIHVFIWSYLINYIFVHLWSHFHMFSYLYYQ